MTITFGATTDDLKISVSVEAFFPNRNVLFMGWFYPTTLTTGRYYMTPSAGLHGISVGSITSELTVTIDRDGTNRVYASSGAGIAINNWYFIACLYSSITSGSGTPYVWIGTVSQIPKEISLALATAGTLAAFVSTDVIIGNNNISSNLAFQGDIGPCAGYGDSINFSINNALGFSPGDVIDQSDRDRLLNKFIVPFYKGVVPTSGNFNCSSGGTSNRRANGWYWGTTANKISDISGLSYVRVLGQAIAGPGGLSLVELSSGQSGRGNPRNIRNPYIQSRNVAVEVA